MAAFPPKDKLVDRRPSLKGILMQDVSNGAERTRAWPRKRGKNVPPAQKERMEWFRQAQWATKYIEPAVMVTFAQATKGTPLLPRDLATMMFAGRFTILMLEDGRKVFSLQQKQDVSFSLDAISQTPGMQLIRGDTYWDAVPQIVGNRVGAKITRSTATANFTSNVENTFSFDTQVLDQAFFWDIANPTKFIIPEVGWYNLYFSAQRGGTTNFGGDVRLYLNGALLATQRFLNITSLSGAQALMQYFDFFQTGDELEWRGINYGTTQSFSGVKCHILGNA